MITIGVLGLQGAVAEHIRAIENLGYKGLVVKHPNQLSEMDGLVLPGGESTVMRKFIDAYGFLVPLRNFAATKKPIFGTCAGMVLLANELIESSESHLKLMDIQVKRNAFGRQRESFEADLQVKGFEGTYPAVFIRAPYIESVGNQVEILAVYEDKIVAARQNNLLTCAFHPELTNDSRFLELFIKMVNESKSKISQEI